jgi:hypothetical protein
MIIFKVRPPERRCLRARVPRLPLGGCPRSPDVDDNRKRLCG